MVYYNSQYTDFPHVTRQMITESSDGKIQLSSSARCAMCRDINKDNEQIKIKEGIDSIFVVAQNQEGRKTAAILHNAYTRKKIIL